MRLLSPVASPGRRPPLQAEAHVSTSRFPRRGHRGARALPLAGAAMQATDAEAHELGLGTLVPPAGLSLRSGPFNSTAGAPFSQRVHAPALSFPRLLDPTSALH